MFSYLSSDSVVIQDLKAKRTIGEGHDHNGLYFLNSNGLVACSATVSNKCVFCVFYSLVFGVF